MHERKETLEKALLCDDLKLLDKEAFVKTWNAVAFLNPGLHIDGFSDPDSGWPEELKPFAEEAWRRYETGEISVENLYPAEEARKGLEAMKNIRENGQMGTVESASYELPELSEKARKNAHSDWQKNLEALNKNSLEKFCETFKISVKDWEYSDRRYINFDLDVDDKIKELSGPELADYLRDNYSQYVNRENYDRSFTGYYMDNVLLDEIWEFIEDPEDYFNFHRLIKECLSDWIIACAEDYANRDEFHIFKSISSASNWRYTKDGRRI